LTSDRPAGSRPLASDRAQAAAVLLLGILFFAGGLAGTLGHRAPGLPPAPTPTRLAPVPAEPRARPAPPEMGRLDVNTAGLEELQGLPGIGPVLARRIAASRETQGPFRAVDDLRRVPGIGPKRFQRLQPLVRTGA